MISDPMFRFSPLLAVFALAACKPEPEPEPTDTDVEPIAVVIPFEARFRDQVATCGPEYDHVGVGDDSVKLQDLRMFVHDVLLVTAAGEAVPVTLDASPWVYDGQIALLDFEDGNYPCDGDADTNTELSGTAPPGNYVGIRFTIGVPFELNHVDPTPFGPPLDAPEMFANTQDGHSFFRWEVEIGGTNPPHRFPLDVRSIGCVNGAGGVTEECASPNRLTVDLPAFDLSASKVVMQLERLAVRNDLDVNQGGALGCASEASDQDCRDLFVAYGLGIAAPTWIFAE